MLGFRGPTLCFEPSERTQLLPGVIRTILCMMHARTIYLAQELVHSGHNVHSYLLVNI